MRENFGFIYKFLTLTLTFVIFSGNFPAFAQAVTSGRKTISSNQSKQTSPKCSGAWTGTILGKNPAKTPEANMWFRSIFYDKPTVAGTWKLKLENTSGKELEAILAIWKDAVK